MFSVFTKTYLLNSKFYKTVLGRMKFYLNFSVVLVLVAESAIDFEVFKNGNEIYEQYTQVILRTRRKPRSRKMLHCQVSGKHYQFSISLLHIVASYITKKHSNLLPIYPWKGALYNSTLLMTSSRWNDFELSFII